ncbi:MAG: hypothetical protein J0H74_29755 [Chitinophagaceae bacterium]|nr:hypothetical protein [Chitinophagaceae bacterium]
MKASFFILTLSLLSRYADAQIDDYFRQRGVMLLAQCAHPTNTFRNGAYQTEDGYVIVDIYYQEGVHTRLKIYRGDACFTGVAVLSDDDIFPPFRFLGSILKTLLQQYEDSEQRDELARQLESILRKRLEEWSGADWSLLIINLDYFSF